MWYLSAFLDNVEYSNAVYLWYKFKIQELVKVLGYGRMKKRKTEFKEIYIKATEFTRV